MIAPPHTRKFLLLTAFLFLCLPLAGQAGSTGQRGHTPPFHPFPLYSAIAGNVSFWEKVYATYSNDTIIVHDRDDLRKIYTTVSLPSPKNADDRKKNLRKEKEITEKYEKMLLALRDRPPKTAEEKRIAAFFTGPDRKQKLTKAAARVRTQNGQRQRFRNSVNRSGAYLSTFKKIFRSYNLPEDLAYIPHVESSFHSRVYSKVGACGIWQFTKTTGKRYLIIDDAVDERLDPIASTHAAARYFRRSYNHLKHWPLAITSYNYGLPGTIRAQKEFRSYPKVFAMHRTQSFQFASRNFYSEFVAAKNIAKKLEKNISLRKPEKTCSMRLAGYLDLRDIINYFQIDSKEIERLNPALRPTVFANQKRITKNYSLHLPQTKAIKRKIANFPQDLYFANQKDILRYHKVRQGESLSTIAARFGVSVATLRKHNKIGKKSLIKIGQKLRLPADARRQTMSKRAPVPKEEKMPVLKKEKSKKNVG